MRSRVEALRPRDRLVARVINKWMENRSARLAAKDLRGADALLEVRNESGRSGRRREAEGYREESALIAFSCESPSVLPVGFSVPAALCGLPRRHPKRGRPMPREIESGPSRAA